MGWSNGISTQIQRNRAWSEAITFKSTSTTRPNHLPISFPTSSLNMSKGNPHTYTHIGRCVKVTELVVMPLSHLWSKSKWLLKLHSPLFTIHCSRLSMANLNWNNPSPTSTIFNFDPNFHADLRKFFVARWLKGRDVWKFPKRLREYSSRIYSRCLSLTLISSPSSFVKFICFSLSMTSKSIE